MYRLRPKLMVKKEIKIYQGYEEIVKKVSETIKKSSVKRIALETYSGVSYSVLIENLKKEMVNALIIDTDKLFLSPEQIFSEIQDDLTDDKVFGRFSHKNFIDFLDPIKIRKVLKSIHESTNPVIVIGVCATKIVDYDFLVYLDSPRWEIQLNLKKGMSNWKGFKENTFNEKLKRAYYFEWPASDAIKDELISMIDLYIDMSQKELPKMILGQDFYSALKEFTVQPFRLVPYFNSGVWGGKWLQENFSVKPEEINLAWGFDGVPEENSLLIGSGEQEIEMPAQNLILLFPKEILGRKVYGRFGKDFPIRFDFLDTIEGQNLSLQVHPTFDYAYRQFGAKYTQDESYYIIDCKPDAIVYLGVKNGVKKDELVNALEEGQKTGKFNEKKYINTLTVKKHDHFLIPGGTIHSSGKDCVVLEISTTPNRFTFKLWDWERVDLDGKPRPISIDRGKHVINTNFDKTFVDKELYNAVSTIQEEKGFIEEHTGLHELEAIETRRLIFSKEIQQFTENSVNMLNLVEGDHVQIKSKNNVFGPFDVYYGETFIIPEQIKEYKIVPVGNEKRAIIMKAFIR